MMRESLPKYVSTDSEYQTPIDAESPDVLDDKRLDLKDPVPQKKAKVPTIRPPRREDAELDEFLDYLLDKGFAIG